MVSVNVWLLNEENPRCHCFGFLFFITI